MTHKNIKEYLRRTGKSERQLAKMLGITQPYVNMLKNGNRRPRPDLALKIEAVTGIPLRNLLTKQGKAVSR